MDDHGFMVIICQNYTPDELRFWNSYAATIEGYFGEVVDDLVEVMPYADTVELLNNLPTVTAQLAMATDTMLDLAKIEVTE